jgi:undecaprenyl diphosphate synthase
MHVAIIMDGNRRWAKSRGVPVAEGYRRGVGSLRAAVRGAVAAGVNVLTVFGFSTENWQRDPSEVSVLMQLCAIFARTELAELQRQNVSVGVVGDLEQFAPLARTAIGELVRATAQNRGLRLNLALNYSGRAEILRAVRQLAAKVETGSLRASEIDETALRGNMYVPKLPDPDLLIRTGGDFRVSNFLLYQLAYTELLMVPVMWPDFTEDDFARAISVYAERCRRFGS